MQKGSNGKDVELLQIQLNLCQPYKEPLIVDGDFGGATERSLSGYSEMKGFGKNTALNANLHSVLQADFAARPKYVIAIDAGHGGIDPQTGLYTTPATNGKRYQHPNTALHTKDGWFFEGFENRIIAFKTIFELRKLGFLVVMASHEYLDWNGTKSNGAELNRRGAILAPYLKYGFVSAFHSMHSNAAPTSIKDPVTKKTIRKRTKAELDAIRGTEIYTIKEQNLSDKVDNFFIAQWIEAFGKEWIRGGGEKTADFAIILEAENTLKAHKAKGVAFLTEVGVYTSEIDCKMLTSESFRAKRVQCNVNAHKAIFDFLK